MNCRFGVKRPEAFDALAVVGYMSDLTRCAPVPAFVESPTFQEVIAMTKKGINAFPPGPLAGLVYFTAKLPYFEP
jgi:hypothetical protein